MSATEDDFLSVIDTIGHLGPHGGPDIESHDVVTFELARRGLARRGLTDPVVGRPGHGGTPIRVAA